MQNKTINYIRRHEILSFIIITYLCSWTIWGILYSSYIGIINNSIDKKYVLLFIILGGFVPSTISMVMTGGLYKRKGLKQLLSRLIKWRFNPVYYIFVIGCIPLIYYISTLIYNTLSNSFQIEFGRQPYSLLISAILILILAGPLGEEIGWRGFLLPRLQKKLSPLKSSLIIGIVWACWHLPLFFISGTSQYGIPFFVFLMSVIFFSMQITWVFNRTKGSLIFPIIYHTAVNTSSSALVHGAIMSNNFLLIFGIVDVIITIAIIFDMSRNKSYKVITTDEFIS